MEADSSTCPRIIPSSPPDSEVDSDHVDDFPAEKEDLVEEHDPTESTPSSRYTLHSRLAEKVLTE